jgi:predicted phosphodiesterase
MEKVDNCLVLNPGNVAGEIYPPTFAVWNTEDGKFELIKVHDLK